MTYSTLTVAPRTIFVRMPATWASFSLALVDILAVTFSLYLADTLHGADIIAGATPLDVTALGLGAGIGFSLLCALRGSYTNGPLI